MGRPAPPQDSYSRASGRRRTAALLLSLFVLSACADGYTAIGPWVAKPEGPPPVVAPPQDPSSPIPPPGEPEPGAEDQDPNVIATGLTVPTGLALLADGSALVGERTTGRILQVFPDASPAVEIMIVPGLDISGDGGLLGLALSPSYAEDGLVYAYVTTPEDNRVVRFPLGGVPNPVFTGIPNGTVHNGGALVFGPDGALYVGTGDTGDSDLAEDEQSLAGKVLRIDIFGAPRGPPAVYTSGHSNVSAMCLGPEGALFGTDVIDDAPDEINLLIENEEYGWPRAASGTIDPVLEIDPPEDGLGGCALIADALVVSTLEGQRIYGVQLDAEGQPIEAPEEFLAMTYGRLRTLVFDVEGALWATTNNRDGIGTPVEDDDRVLRILNPPIGGGGGDKS